MNLQHLTHVFRCFLALAQSCPRGRKQPKGRGLITHAVNKRYSCFEIMQEVVCPSSDPPIIVWSERVQRDRAGDLLQRLIRLTRMDQRIPEIQKQVSELRV